ncbi:WYL domain-containing protein [Kineosporia sp. NBRC 101731]|uniref:helix-turn-helix transcriptional regulator n=1 Tax=Kineosporia sp. NBRC 101731 TaxID=3032199 RepID=UPI0024A359A5|nr:WYL domain-containing protein [Kineosporia sp. NBRC 101731]GLY31837.1 WYL domain-containing protein [Kineosporia sp. NBRC 101731]
MSSRRTERLLNLVICLAATRRWLTKEQIRSAVPQYADGDTAEAFDRMFERDKEDLRDLGIPVVTGTDERWFDDEPGYRIDRDDYALPPIELDAQELAVVGLASRVWQQAGLAGPAARALTKLTALGVDTDDAGAGLEPRIRTPEPAFGPLYAATRDRQAVTFSYRKPNGDLAVREVEPWAVASRNGRWYLIGNDRGRGAARVFRLSRIESDVKRRGRAGAYGVPESLDAQSMIGKHVPPVDDRVATVLLRTGRGAGLRRQVVACAPSAQRPGWDELQIRIGDAGMLAQSLAGLGPDAIALEPADLRGEVVRRLKGALATQAELVAPDVTITPEETIDVVPHP